MNYHALHLWLILLNSFTYILTVSKSKFVQIVCDVQQPPIPPTIIKNHLSSFLRWMRKSPSIMLQFWQITILILIRLSLSRSQARYHKDLNFNPLTIFEALLKDHPLWNQLNNVLTIGAFFPLWDISASTRKDDINFHLKRGNLKSATTYHNIFDLLIKETWKGTLPSLSLLISSNWYPAVQ